MVYERGASREIALRIMVGCIVWERARCWCWTCQFEERSRIIDHVREGTVPGRAYHFVHEIFRAHLYPPRISLHAQRPPRAVSRFEGAQTRACSINVDSSEIAHYRARTREGSRNEISASTPPRTARRRSLRWKSRRIYGVWVSKLEARNSNSS